MAAAFETVQASGVVRNGVVQMIAAARGRHCSHFANQPQNASAACPSCQATGHSATMGAYQSWTETTEREHRLSQVLEFDPSSANTVRQRRISRIYVWLIVLVAALPGCGGCRQEGDQLTREEIEKRAREQRDSLEMSELLTLPADSETKILTAKPGHWHETQQQFKSNREDMQVLAVGSISRGNQNATIPGTSIQNQFTRRTSLPKGQTKTVDLQYFVPFSGVKSDPLSTQSTKLNFQTDLLTWPLMTPILQAPNRKPANELLEHEFQLIALSPQATSYEYLTVLDAVFWRGAEFMIEERTRSYYVSLVRPVDGKYSFPRSMLTMTAMAVVVWDDVSPDDLSLEQQQALIDWIHWGGQLLVSGPSSWSRLQNSFLSPYLPANAADAAELGSEDFAELSRTWTVEDRTPKSIDAPIEIVGAKVGGSRFKLNDRGSWLPGSGEMVAESQVGRGRIVLTAFPMREPRIYRWKYFSNFFSTGLLRRHPRVFRRSAEDRSLAQYWAKPFDSAQHDARLHTNVRILTRDLPLASQLSKTFVSEDADALQGMGGDSFNDVASSAFNAPPVNNAVNANRTSAEAAQWGGRGAAWNDYSGLSFQALQALKSAAGIELPSRRTIIYLLAGYLACLVPLNWLVFRLIGRLEFAWIAAPLMAIGGVVVVTKVARLDIGFARRTTEISVLELQGDHPRGHLTQYLALYTSLSTNYAVEFPEGDSVALPLRDISRNTLRAAATSDILRTNYGRSEGVILEPLTVYSNSTEMLHAEQIVTLEGGLRLGTRDISGDGPEILKNDTGIGFKGCLLLRRTVADVVEMCWVGDLTSGQSVNLQYVAAAEDQLWKNWRLDPTTQPEEPTEPIGAGTESDAVWIGGVLQELVRKTPLMPGQSRLFGYTEKSPGKLNLEPIEDQFDGRCVVIAHLTPQVLANVVPDLNIMSRVSSLELDAANAEELGQQDLDDQ